MAADNGAANNGNQASTQQQGHSLPRRAVDRLRFLLGLEDLSADPGETYQPADGEAQPLAGAVNPGQDLGPQAGAAALPAEADAIASSAPLSSDPLPELDSATLDPGAAGTGGSVGDGAAAAEAAASFDAAAVVTSTSDGAGSPVAAAAGAAGGGGGGGGASAPPAAPDRVAPLAATLSSTGGVEEDRQLSVAGAIQLQGGWQAQVVAGTFQGAYGLLSVDAGGHWIYHLDNDSPAVQRLNNGEVVQEHFHCLAVDGTGQRLDVPIIINVNGRDDAAVISGVRSGAITEDVGLQRTGGQLNVSDLDHGDQPTFVPQSVKGQYGSLNLQSDGHWTYTADPQKIQGLAQGQQVADSFPVWTTNAQGESVRATVSVAVVGTDDGATFPPLSLSAVEDGGTVSGRLLATDVDARSLTYGPMPGSAPSPGVTIDADGMVHVDPSRPEFQSLAAGEFRTLQIPVQVVDERGTCTNALLQVQVAGSNDVPTVIVRPPLPVNEGGGTESVQVLASDVDASDRLVYGLPPGVTAPAGVSLNQATGQVSIDTNHPAYNHLAAGEVQMVVVPVLVSDGHGGSTLTQVSFELHGSNDAPSLAAVAQRTATEGGAPLTGQLSGTDPDSSDQLIYGLAGGAAAPAGFSMQSDGHWGFDPRDPAYDHLRAGEQQQILVPVQVSDGHGGVSQQTLTITVTGTNDGAVIGGAHTGHVQEDMHSSISGLLTISDADQGENHFQPQTISGHFGTLTIDLDGHWTYQLDNSNPAIQALPAGNSLIESLIVKSADGTNQRISISIHGSDDAAVIKGAHSGTVKEDGASTASGQLQVSDVDQGQNPAFHAETLQGVFGQLVIDTSGHWSYQLDNAAAQVLQGGTKARETFTVLASDSQGHQVSQAILVDVQGTADAAVISGTATGRVSEDQVLQARGKLDVADPDRNEAHFNSGDQSGTYGSLHLEADGSWSYQLNNASPLVQQLTGSDQVSDRFTVTSADGTTHQISVQVAGRNDVAQISGSSSGQVTEDGQQRATGQLSVSDVDRGEAHFQAGDQVGTYGSLHLGADGAWTYTLNNNDPKVQALGAGSSATDTFTVRSADGTTHQLSVRVAGINDAAVISGTSTGQLREDATLSASGQLQVADVDQGEAAIRQSDVGDKVGIYGTLHMHADGSWTYELNNKARVVQDLQAGDLRQDSFMVHSIDGTSHQLQMNVQGSSDAPVLSAGQISGAKEDVSFTVSQAQILTALQARDPDGDPLSVSSLGYGGSDATLVDNHNGTWTLTPHANWSGNLSFQVGVSDGHDVTTGTLTVPIAAVADTATMTVAPSLSSTFEDPNLGSRPNQFTSPTQWGWHTDNVSGLVEQGKGQTYGDPDSKNTGLIELEGYKGENDNLYRVLDTQPGAAYHFSLDVSGRVGASSASAQVEVLWEGVIIDTITPADNTFGFHNHAYDLTAHSEHPRIEFRAVTHDGSGPIVDNVNFEFRGFNGTEDTELPIKLSVETVDKDGSETITTGIKGLPPGFAITDGTTGHRLTSTGPTQTLDMQGWDLQHLKVVPAANFNGRVNAVLIATTTESSNHDQAVTQIPVPLNFAAVNDPPTVNIGTSGALAEESTETRTDQITGSDSDGDATSIDTGWLIANHWSTSDSGRTYTKTGTYGTATLTVATNQVSYQLNNTPGGPTDRLAAGQNGRDAFEVQITDGHGGSVSGTAIFNVNGTNDAPTVTAGVASATLIEGRSDTATSVLTILDKDSTDASPTVDTAWLSNHGWTTADGGQTYTKAGTYGDATLTVMTNTVSYHLNNTPGGATDLLRAGAAAQDQFQVQVVDIHGATATTQVGFNLSGTNDAPIATAQTLGLQEDTNYHFQAADFGYQDIEGESLHHIAITSLPAGTSGKLTLDGHDVTVNQQIAAADLSRLLFEPAANFNGDSHFNYKVNDGLTDSKEATAVLRVAAVNDPPQFLGGGVFKSLPISAAYEFSGTAGGKVQDLSSNSNDGVPNAGTALTIGHDGTANSAIHFDGVSGSVKIPDINTGQGITLSCWAKYDNLGDFWSRIFDVGNGPGRDNILMAHVERSDTIRLSFFDAAHVEHALDIPHAIVPGEWAHFTGSISHDGRITLYKNGALLGSLDTGVALPAVQRTSNFLGQSNWPVDSHFTGALGSVAIFDRDIGEQEARALFQTSNLKDLLNKYDSISGSSFHAYSQENHPFVITRDEILRQVTDVDHDTLSLQSITCSGSNARVVDNHNGTYTVTPNSGYRGAVSLTVQVSDGHATVDGTITVDFTRTGLPNHAPVLQVQSKTVTEDSGILTSQMIATDPDSGETQTFSIGTSVAGLSFHADGSYSFDSSHADYQGLKAGETRMLTIPVTVTDSSGATSRQNLTITVTGTNDAPVLTAQSKTATEDSSALSGQMVATDLDQGDTQTFSIPNAVPGLTFHADGSYSFNPSDADYQSLKAGEIRTLSIPVTVTDSAGATSHQNLTITVTGTNDAPVLSAQSKAATEDGSVVTGQMVATDSDRGDTQTFSIANPVAGLSFHADGSYSFNPSDAAYQSLKAGETRALTIPVTVTDSSGASTQQNLSITVTGTNEAPTVTATTGHSATLTSALEDTAQTYSSAYLLGQVGAADSDSDVAHLSVTDVHVDPTYGSFRSSVSPSGTTDWIFTPAANYASTPGTPIPITLTIRDEQGGVTTAYAQTSVSSVTDTATPALTVSVEHEVMLFGSKAQPAAANNSHVYAQVGGGQLTQATFELISVGDPKNPGDRTAATGPVILNLAIEHNNNLVSFWRPANLSIAFNGVDYYTDRNLASDAKGGIDMTTGTHRVTATWDSATGTLNIYDNGKLHNSFTGVLMGSSLDLTSGGHLTLGQKMNDPSPSTLGGFRANEQYNGTIFSASFGTKALDLHDIQSGPMANLPPKTSQLQANFQARNGAVANELSGPSGSTSAFNTGAISFKKEYIDVSAMPPPVGATLKLTLNVAAPSDTDDTISRQWLRGLPVGTVLSDGNGHQLTVGSNTLVNITAETHSWVLTNGLVAQLPAGYNTNLPLQLVAESTGPDGSIARSTGDALIVFNPDGTKTPLSAPTDADLGVAPAPPPPAPGAGAATAVASASMDHLEMADGISRPTELADHHTAADSTHADGVQGLPSSQDLVALPAPSTGAGLGSADSAEAKTLSDPALDPDALQSAAHFLATSTNPEADQAGMTPNSADHADPSIGLPIDPIPEAPDLSADLLAQAAKQLTSVPGTGVETPAPGSGGQAYEPDSAAVPVSVVVDPFTAEAPPADAGVDPVLPPADPQDQQQDPSVVYQ